jgi:hypothetical protein
MALFSKKKESISYIFHSEVTFNQLFNCFLGILKAFTILED